MLFADIKGSTELIASLDPEAARDLLDPALHLMMEAVHRIMGAYDQAIAAAQRASRLPWATGMSSCTR